MIQQKRLYIKTYGCQMNVYDSARMADILSPLGYVLSDTPETADLIILNTCHIREKADEKLYSDLGRIRPYKDDKVILAVAGCVAQAEGAEIMRRAPYVDLVFGPQTYHRLPEMIARAHRSQDKVNGPGRGILDVEFPPESKFDHLPQAHLGVGPTAFLAIQEGCDKFCTFCVVPYTRGAEYSRPVHSIYEEAQSLIDKGAKEITLLGQNVNAYHGLLGRQEVGLGKLLEHLASLKGLERLRYMTSHPRDMDEELMVVHRDIPQVMPYLHLPIQSGSDQILEAMNRKHTRQQYMNIISKMREYRPDIALSSDFIVGFPGETDQDFEDTLELVREVQFAQAYSFKYSPRHGTPGALMENQISEEVKVERLAHLQKLLSEQQQAFNDLSVGQTMPVLLDRKGKKDEQFLGKTPYMQSVYVNASPRLLGQCVDVVIEKAFSNSLTGSILTDEIVLK
ncbi:MAG: tRNA (N6-isopentenyl adenosine(37)-C2)-methylthiotransferase MiaB [Alphaproteobacteria bacterium]|nr:tRNA (N6-isopentenyl adenosine(37)-C2)-methylthiotransferase MiaB [Alphaproteobacteria bacterium]